MREWLLGLVPVVLVVDLVVNPGHMSWLLAAAMRILR